ncbi:hypothetical protein UY3_01415 [Chelonia mydas]|uniref:Uncharacterized protein n=1 Tax=Chelonia mydas TaxID=8469 RepID=M7BVV7_CHEMY|nr:hypothetical protein UY3_01415 [Chelonia mydas]
MLSGRALVGTLALPEGLELLDRKQRSKQVLESPDSDLPPSHWLLAPSTLCPLGCPSRTPPGRRALRGCICIRSTIRKNGPRMRVSVDLQGSSDKLDRKQ